MDGDLVTADWQMEYDGIALGDGSPYLLAQVEGLLNLPDLLTTDSNRLRRHGQIAGDDFAAGRSVVLTLEVGADDATAATFNAAVDELVALTTPGGPEIPLYFQIPGVAGGGKRIVMCRPRRRNLAIGREFYYGLPLATVEFYSTNPRILSADLYEETTTLPSAGGGLSFDITPDFVFGAVSIGGTLTLQNEGTFNSSPIIRIDGPVTNPRVESITQGKTLALDITVGVGEYLTIDTELRTVLLDDTASRYNALTTTSQWFDLSPGENEVRFQASTPTAATMTIAWRSAWV